MALSSDCRHRVVYLLLLSGCIASSQRNDNVYVSGFSNACGDVAELLRASSGVITSPGWPFQYPARLNCTWNIRARPGDSITISFQDFDLQGSHHCTSDWMSISSYRSLDGLRVCGSSLPPPYLSSQDHVWIHFHSDDGLAGKGFRLSYVTGEDGALSSLRPNGTISGASSRLLRNGWSESRDVTLD